MALSETSCVETAGRCRVHGATIEAERQTYQAEVLALRRRVEALENALAIAEATSNAQVISFRTGRSGPAPTPESRADEPAAVRTGAPEPTAEADPTAAAEVRPTGSDRGQPGSSGPGSANGWCDADDTVEERLAAKAFFNEDAIDSSARRWLLKN